MKQLTFLGFLKKYLKDLSLCESCSVTKLEKELDKNIRLLEPLTLYIKMIMTETQISSIKNQKLQASLLQTNNISNVEEALQREIMSENFQKVYTSYKFYINKKDRENNMKKIMLKRIQKLQKEKQISNYKIYTNLHLNAGNINAFLSNNNVEKLSINTAEKILQYVSAI